MYITLSIYIVTMYITLSIYNTKYIYIYNYVYNTKFSWKMFSMTKRFPRKEAYIKGTLYEFTVYHNYNVY